MPCVTLRDRRAGGRPLVRFVFQRHLESVLYGRAEGSSGPIWKLLNATGMGATALQVSKVSVTKELLTQPEFEQLMAISSNSTSRRMWWIHPAWGAFESARFCHWRPHQHWHGRMGARERRLPS